MFALLFLWMTLSPQRPASVPSAGRCKLSMYAVDASDQVGSVPIISPDEVLSITAAVSHVTNIKMWEIKLTPRGAASNWAYTQAHLGEKVAVFCGTRKVEEPTVQGVSSDKFEIFAPSKTGKPLFYSSKRLRKKSSGLPWRKDCIVEVISTKPSATGFQRGGLKGLLRLAYNKHIPIAGMFIHSQRALYIQFNKRCKERFEMTETLFSQLYPKGDIAISHKSVTPGINTIDITGPSWRYGKGNYWFPTSH